MARCGDLLHASSRSREAWAGPGATAGGGRAAARHREPRAEMVDVVEIEVQRARQWLRARRRADERLRSAVFRRVKAQMAFADLRRELRRAEEEDEDAGDDLALDFLSDVNADDMSALLRAEAASSAAAAVSTDMSAASTTATTAAAAIAAVDPALKPIDMPSHLMAGPVPRRVASNGFGLAVGGASSTASSVRNGVRKSGAAGSSLSLASDEHVDELIQDLQLDLHAASSDDERKTEESSPPHLAKERQDQSASITNAKVCNPELSSVSTNGIAKGMKPNGVASTPTNDSMPSTKPMDAVASEMLSWVSGVRDPTVLSKKEALAQRKRRRTIQYGVGSLEEQRYVQKSVKYYTQGSDSEDISPASDNDYSPSEDPPEFDPDEQLDPDEVLGDEDSDSERKKPKKRRLKKPKKAAPSAKTATTPVAQKEDPQRLSEIKSAMASIRASVKAPLVSKARLITISDESDDGENDHLAANTNGKFVPVSGIAKKPLHSAATKALPDQDPSLSNGMNAGTESTSATAGYETPELLSDEGVDEEAKPTTAQAKAKTRSPTPPQPDDDVSETETVDFDFDAGGDQDDSADIAVGDRGDKKKNSEEDVSDAETVILESDEEGEVRSNDDLGLDYSDDSDDAPLSSVLKNSSSTETTSSAPGVVQFFDMKPLRTKKRVETRKVIPVHSESEFMLKKQPASTVVDSTQPNGGTDKNSANSNGTRHPKTNSIHTSTTMKGSHPVIRRSIKLMGDDDKPLRGGSKARIAGAANEASSSGGGSSFGANVRPTAANGLRKSTHSAKRTSSQKDTDDSGTSRYLSYAGAKGSSSGSASKAVKSKPVPTVTPSRFGGGGGNYGADSVGVSSTTAKQYPRDPQISLYDALHLDDKEESASYLDRDSGYKRPTAFKKLQAESVRTGVPIVTSKAKEPDWDRIPIPKKGIAFTSGVPEPRPSKVNEQKASKKQEKAPAPETPSHYGPGGKASSKSWTKSKETYRPEYDKSKYRGRGADNSRYQSSKYDNNRYRGKGRRRSTSPSPSRRGDSRYRSSDKSDGRKSYSDSNRRRSRSPSPHNRDRERERGWQSRDAYQRSRSPSPAWKRQRVDERSTYNAEKDPRRRSMSPRRNEVSSGALGNTKSKPQRDLNSYEDEPRKKQKLSGFSDPRQSEPPMDGGLASFDDDNAFISESDAEIEIEMEKEQEDIRYDLKSVEIDSELITRRVYVTDLNPAICVEELEEEMAPFGLATDRSTGFPWIDLYTCQRNLRARGDACVTFLTAEGAKSAVEELNSKNVKNSLIHVRMMDEHTQRILNAQFNIVRDTWKCSSTNCRAEVSTWDNVCSKCRRKRCFGPSHLKITRDSWLCSICFSANDEYDTTCKGCGESLPDRGRFASYRN